MSSPRISQTLPRTTPPAVVEPTYIPELTADRIATGELTGAVITVGEDGVIKAGLGSTTVEIVKDGLFGYIDNQLAFRLAEGKLFVKGTVEADDGYFAGTVTAESLIAGADIRGSNISGGTITIGDGSSVFRAGALGIALGGDFLTAPFRVTPEGQLTAQDAVITGTITGSEIVGSTIIGTTIIGGSITGAEISAQGTFSTGASTDLAHMRMRQVPGDEATDIYDVGYGIIEWFVGRQAAIGPGDRAYITATRLPGAVGQAQLTMGIADATVVCGWVDTPGGMRSAVSLTADQVYFNGTKMWGAD